MTGPCRFLRWKGYHARAERDVLEQSFLTNRVPYSCLRTCQPWGSDGEPAAPEACTPERDCFSAHESLLSRIGSALRPRRD